MDIKEKLLEQKLIAIARGIKTEDLPNAANALLAGGMTFIECTFDQSGNVYENAKSILLLKKQFGEQMQVGAGTVMTVEQVNIAAESGAQYIISPNCDIEVISQTKKAGLVSIPGCMTPSEVAQAHIAGADFIKLFPMTSLGPDYLKALRGPMPHIKFLAVGGIDTTNIKEYIAAGALGFGIGGNLLNQKLIAEKNWEEITHRAKLYRQSVKSI